MTDQPKSSTKTIAILVVLAAVVIGGLVYVSGQFKPGETVGETVEDVIVEVEDVVDASTEQDVQTDVADAETPTIDAVTAPEPAEQVKIKPGNPVVAKVGDKEITRQDVLNAVRMLPPQTQQLPIEQLFPLVQNQVVSMAIVEKRAEKEDLSSDPEVKKQLETVKKQIVRNVYMSHAVNEALTDERLKGAYDEYKANFPDVKEAHAYHILVEDESLAKDLIKQINDGADFAELAKEYSIDPTGQEGGDLGYFAKKDVVPEFSEAAFSQKLNAISKAPVESQYGYHIIKTVDIRKKEPAPYEQLKPMLEAQLRQLVMKEKLEEWQKEANVQLFDINGEAPAEETPAEETPAEETPAEETPAEETPESETEPAAGE